MRFVCGASVLGEPQDCLADLGVTSTPPWPSPAPKRGSAVPTAPPLRADTGRMRFLLSLGTALDTCLPRTAGCRAVWAAEG